MALQAWAVFFIFASLCLSTSVAENTLEFENNAGRQSYFDTFHQGVQKQLQVQESKNQVAAVQMLELWSSLVSAPTTADTGGHRGKYAFLGEPARERSSGVGGSLLMSAVQDTLQAGRNGSTNNSSCAMDLSRVFVSLLNREMWALNYLDSAGKPGPSLLQGRLNFVGNYKQCRAIVSPPDDLLNKTSFGANYVVVGLARIASADPLAQIPIKLSICVPATCSEDDIKKLSYEVLVRVNLTSSLIVTSVDIRDSEREVTPATVVAIVVICIIGSLMILGTAFDIIFVQWPKWQLQAIADQDGLVTKIESGHNPSGYEAIGGDDRRHVNDDKIEGAPLLAKPPTERAQRARCAGTLAKVLLAFSVYTNGSKVLNTSQPPGSITCVHGIRFLSLSWVILGHSFGGAVISTENLLDIVSYIRRWTFDAVSNASFSVDTFFALSGLLTAYTILKEMKKRGWRINWALVYFHRYWRLTPPYMLTLLLMLGLQRFLGQGELWASTQPADKEFCEKNWWTNMLYINNLVNAKELCFGHSWYLANDMQFFVLSPLMLIPFCFHKFAGIASCLIFMLASMITTGVLSTHYEWGPNFVSLVQHQTEGQMTFNLKYYEKPWCRIGPYIVGILTGYLLVSSNNKIRMNRVFVVAGWAVAVATSLAILYGIHGYITGDSIPAVGVSALYNTVARSLWAGCVCWVIVCCVSGYGGFVNTLLSWSPFVVLGRLSYMAYLIHPSIIFIYTGSKGQLYHVTDLNNIVLFLGILFLSYMVAFVLMLGLESPMIGLEKIFLPQRKKD